MLTTSCEHVFADLGAAGLHPAAPPVAQTGPNGVVVALACHGGHVAIHALAETGICFADVVAIGKAQPRRGLNIIIRRLDARDVRTDARYRTPAPTTHSERA